MQRNSNAPQLGAQEKAGLLKLHMNFLVLDDTEKAIDRVIKKNKYTELYGIRIQDIINHIGPCPGNLSEYHIDHIKPISKFDLTNEEEQKKCFHYTNLQPLFAIDNLRKSNKYQE